MEDPSTHQVASDHLEAKSEAMRRWVLGVVVVVVVDHSRPEKPNSLRPLPNSHRMVAVAIASLLHWPHPQAAAFQKWRL